MTIKYPDFDLAQRHRDFSYSLMIAVEKQSIELVKAMATDEARRLYNMHRQVSCEIHRLESFTRLNISKKGILYGSISPEHNVEEPVLNFFKNRFPAFIILIESKKKELCYVSKPGQKYTIIKKTLSETLVSIELDIPDNKIAHELVNNNSDINSDDEDIWRTFYETQYIKERRNKRYFHKSMPRKILKGAGLATELRMSVGSKELNEYLK
jgi:probable DNA metabolism protein